MSRLAVLALSSIPACLLAQTPAARDLNDLNWQEFRDLVPARIETVLLPTGTLEAHGAINNGADNTAPQALARAMAKDLNALVAPLIPYGVTGSLDGYPGTFQIGEPAYRAFMTDIITGLAKQGFKNIVVVNGHGGPQTAILSEIAEKVGRSERTRILVANWWAICSDVTVKVFGEDGGHAGWNETAFVQAVDRTLVKPQLHSKDMELPRAAPGTSGHWRPTCARRARRRAGAAHSVRRDHTARAGARPHDCRSAAQRARSACSQRRARTRPRARG